MTIAPVAGICPWLWLWRPIRTFFDSAYAVHSLIELTMRSKTSSSSSPGARAQVHTTSDQAMMGTHAHCARASRTARASLRRARCRGERARLRTFTQPPAEGADHRNAHLGRDVDPLLEVVDVGLPVLAELGVVGRHADVVHVQTAPHRGLLHLLEVLVVRAREVRLRGADAVEPQVVALLDHVEEGEVARGKLLAPAQGVGAELDDHGWLLNRAAVVLRRREPVLVGPSTAAVPSFNRSRST
eukprot:COSAG06_NODE_14114_length_1188_cov_2.344353_1_plen_243_part_00